MFTFLKLNFSAPTEPIRPPQKLFLLIFKVLFIQIGFESSFALIKNSHMANRNYEKLRKSARSFFIICHCGSNESSRVPIGSRSVEPCEIFCLEHRVPVFQSRFLVLFCSKSHEKISFHFFPNRFGIRHWQIVSYYKV